MDKAVPILAGVLQGSTLSPLLYNLYTSDIPRSVRTELSVYADDICIYHKNRSARFAHLAVQRHKRMAHKYQCREDEGRSLLEENQASIARTQALLRGY